MTVEGHGSPNASRPGIERRDVLEELARHIAGMRMPHPVRVAIDGVDASGKTTLADELAEHTALAGRVIRGSIDGFHQPRARRLDRGPLSAEGYYEDSFNLEALAEKLLRPLGPGGERAYALRIFDYRQDTEIREPARIAPADSVLLFDGVFLLRPELRSSWDLRIFVHADFDVTLGRAMRRDLSLFGSEAVVRQRYCERYIPGQKLYLARCDPMRVADFVLENNDPARPRLLRRLTGPLASW